MPLLNDNDIDRLSREAAEQYDVDQGPAGWDALQQRLDGELPEKRRRGLLLWWLLAGLLLAGGAWLLMNREGSSNIVSEKTATQKELQPVTAKTPASAGTTAEDDPLTAGQPSRTSGRTNETQDQKTKAELSVNNNERTIENSKQYRLSKNRSVDRTVASNNFSFMPGASGTQAPAAPAASNTNLRSTMNKETAIPAPPVTPETTQNISSDTLIATAITDSNQSVAVTSSVPKKIPLTPNPDTTNSKPLPSFSSRKHSFYAALIAGPDFSNVKFSTAGRTGFNTGVQFGFYLTDRLSLNTGIVYNKKNYKARGKDFTAKGAMRYVDVKEINGNCTMFDIPLNVRYDISVKQRSRYFISGGLSGYLMDKEDYDYYYYYNGVYGERNWNTDSNSNYLFSVINLSGGWESAISNKLQLQAEPYLKIPLRGIGNGNIQLNSFGLNLGLKYRFGKNSGNK